MSVEKKVFKNTLTLRSLTIGIVSSAITTYLLGQGWIIGHNSPLGLGNLNWPGASDPSAPQFQFFGPLLIIVAFMLLIPKKYRLNSAEIVFVLTCVVTVPTLIGDQGLGVRWMSTFSHHVIMYPTRTAEVLGNMSPLLWPKDTTVLDGMRYGTLTAAQIPWAAWTTPLMFQMALFIVLRLFFLFGSSIMQEQFVDLEFLPFPVETVNYALVNVTASEESEKSGMWKNKTSKLLFVVAFLVGILYWLVVNSSVWYPGMTIVTFVPGRVDLTPQHYYAGILVFNFELFVWGWVLLMPVDVSLTLGITELIFYWMLVPMLVGAGQIGDWGTGRDSFYVMRNFWPNLAAPTTVLRGGFTTIYIGLMIGIAITPLITFRKNIVASIRKAISGGQSDFISPRVLWGGWALTGLILIVLFAAVQIPIYYSFVLLAIISIWYLAMAREAAVSGLWVAGTIDYPPPYTGNSFNYYGMTPFGLAPYNHSAEAFNTAFVGATLLLPWNAGHGGASANPMIFDMEMFKLSQLTNADRRKMTVAMIINSILPIVIVMPLAIYLLYTQGGWQPRNVYNTSRTIHEAWNFANTGVPAAFQNSDPSTVTWALLPVGIIIVMVISFARVKFAGPLMYISPIGMVFALSDWGQYLWPAIIAAFIRLIAVRTAGPTVVEEKINPIAIGIIASTGITWMIRTICWVLRGLGYVWWVV